MKSLVIRCIMIASLVGTVAHAMQQKSLQSAEAKMRDLDRQMKALRQEMDVLQQNTKNQQFTREERSQFSKMYGDLAKKHSGLFDQMKKLDEERLAMQQTTYAQSTSQQPAAQSQTPLETSKLFWEYGKNTDIGFELVNQAATPIEIELSYMDNNNRKVIVLEKKLTGAGWLVYDRVSAPYDINKCYSLLIKNAQGNFSCYTFVPGKTVYVQWDGKRLHSQNGSGYVPVTMSGCILRNNINEGEIMQLEDIKK